MAVLLFVFISLVLTKSIWVMYATSGHGSFDGEKKGNVIEDFDLMIGTTGVIGDLTVVTRNTKHFSRIEGIKLEDWAL